MPNVTISTLGNPARSAIVFGIGACTGAFAWFASANASGAFEPYNSSIGILVNQAILVTAAFWAGLRMRPWFVLLFLVGLYFGLNAYSYVFGNSETRVWAALGAVVNVILLILPGFCSLAPLAYRWARPHQ